MRNAKLDVLCRNVTGYGLNQLKVRTRKRPIAMARKSFAVFLTCTTPFSYSTIAEIVGWNGDHSLVSKAVIDTSIGAFRKFDSADYPKKK